MIEISKISIALKCQIHEFDRYLRNINDYIYSHCIYISPHHCPQDIFNPIDIPQRNNKVKITKDNRKKNFKVLKRKIMTENQLQPKMLKFSRIRQTFQANLSYLKYQVS